MGPDCQCEQCWVDQRDVKKVCNGRKIWRIWTKCCYSCVLYTPRGGAELGPTEKPPESQAVAKCPKTNEFLISFCSVWSFRLRSGAAARRERELQHRFTRKLRAIDNGGLIKDPLWNQFCHGTLYLQKKLNYCKFHQIMMHQSRQRGPDRMALVHWTSLISQCLMLVRSNTWSIQRSPHQAGQLGGEGGASLQTTSFLDRKAAGLEVCRKHRWQSEWRTQNWQWERGDDDDTQSLPVDRWFAKKFKLAYQLLKKTM